MVEPVTQETDQIITRKLCQGKPSGFQRKIFTNPTIHFIICFNKFMNKLCPDTRPISRGDYGFQKLY